MDTRILVGSLFLPILCLPRQECAELSTSNGCMGIYCMDTMFTCSVHILIGYFFFFTIADNIVVIIHVPDLYV